MPPEDNRSDPRVYLAAERTFLAWIRTGIALMAFGFVVSRFGLFLRVLEASRAESPSAPSSLSLPLGVAFVLIGVAVNIFSAWNHIRYIRALNRGLPTTGRPSMLAVVLALVLAAAGVVMAFYLGATTKAHLPTPSGLSNGHVSENMVTEGLLGACHNS